MRASEKECVIIVKRSLITICVRSRIFACCFSGFSKFQSSLVARSVERLIVWRNVGRLSSLLMMRGGRTAFERLMAAAGLRSYSLADDFGDPPPLRLLADDALLVRLEGDLRFI